MECVDKCINCKLCKSYWKKLNISSFMTLGKVESSNSVQVKAEKIDGPSSPKRVSFVLKMSGNVFYLCLFYFSHACWL